MYNNPCLSSGTAVFSAHLVSLLAHTQAVDEVEIWLKEKGMNRAQVTEILNKPYAQELINSNIPTRLAYTGLDGTPRVIPIATHWNGGEFVACTPDNAPKVPALKADPRVALTIDTEQQPPHILLVRGTAAMEIVDGIPEEYLLAARKMYGAEAMPEFEANVRALYKRMARIAITPAWAKLIDFETTLPSAIEEILRQQAPAQI
jgi:hypothetical protein